MSTRNLNKKRTVIISVAALAITACITTAAILLTNRSSAEEVETTTSTETISETETYTIKPIPHTTAKPDEPKEITEISQKTEIIELETVTFAPEPENGNVILDDDSAAILEEHTNAHFEFSLGEKTFETLEEEYVQTTEAITTTAATTTLPPEEIDWSGIVDDDGVIGGTFANEDRLGQGGGEIGEGGGGGWIAA